MNHLLSTSKTLLTLLLVLSTTVIFHSCIKDQGFFDDNLIPVGEQDNPFTDTPKEVVITNIFGSVVDENDNPIANSDVSLNTLRGVRTTTTDEYGNFLYTKVMVVKSGALLKVRQAGKFEAFRKMNVTADSYNYTKIKLLQKNILGAFSSNTGGTAQTVNSAKVKLAANSVRHKNGENYMGDVEVAMSWINPTAEDLAERMIGDLSGIDENGKQVALGTFGMLNVELLGENGEELQLKEGMPATLTFPVPSKILSQAPPTIPLWSFDENLGTWVEEGFATLQGNTYVGEVAHFSAWNVDIKQGSISVTGKVFTRVNEEDIVIPYLQVFVEIEGVRRVGGFLDDSGEFEFYNFPANTVFTLSILDPCGGVLWEEELGPYASNTDLGAIIILAPENNFVTISGSGTNCNGEPLEEGYVNFTLNDISIIYPLQENGNFEFVTNTCGSMTGEITLVDLSMFKASEINTVTFEENYITVGAIEACAQWIPPIVEIEILNFIGNTYENAKATFVLDNMGTYTITIRAEKYPNSMDLKVFEMIINNVSGVGSYNTLSKGYAGVPSPWYGTYFIEEDTQVNITSFGTRITGNFSGRLWYSDHNNRVETTMNGTFNAIRQ